MAIDIKKLVEEGVSRTPQVRSAEYHRVTCPHCIVGYADALVSRSAGQAQVNMRDPVRCVACGRDFKLKGQFRIIGVPMQ